MAIVRVQILNAIAAKDVHALRRFAQMPTLEPDDVDLIGTFAVHHLDWSLVKRLVQNPAIDAERFWCRTIAPMASRTDKNHPDLAECLTRYARTAGQWTTETTHGFIDACFTESLGEALKVAAEHATHPQGFTGANLHWFRHYPEELWLACEIGAARNPNTAPAMLANWAHHEEFEVRKVVHQHPNTPPEARQALVEEFGADDRTTSPTPHTLVP